MRRRAANVIEVTKLEQGDGDDRDHVYSYYCIVTQLVRVGSPPPTHTHSPLQTQVQVQRLAPLVVIHLVAGVRVGKVSPPTFCSDAPALPIGSACLWRIHQACAKTPGHVRVRVTLRLLL